MVSLPILDSIFIKNFNIFGTIFVLVVGILLGLLVYLASSENIRFKRRFFILILFNTLWALSSFLTNIGVFQNETFTLYSLKITFFLGILFSIYYYLFINEINHAFKFYVVDKVIMFFGIIIAYLTLFSDYIISDFNKNNIINPIFGDLRNFFFFFVFIVILISIYKLIYIYIKKKSLRDKIKYFIIGTLLFVVANLIFNGVIPFLYDTYEYYYFGVYSSIFLIILITNGVVKKNLFAIQNAYSFLMLVLLYGVFIFDLAFFTNSSKMFEFKVVSLLIIFLLSVILIKAIANNINYLKELEEKSKLQLEVNKKLTQSYKKLKEIDKAKSEFVSITSHQLRTPLSAITGYLSLIKDGTYGIMPENLREPIDNIEEMSKRLSLLVGNLLNISRIEAGRIEFQPKEINISEIIKKVTNEMKVNIEKKGLYLKLHLPEEDIYIQADEEKIINIITNLIDNAIKYTDKGGIDVYLEEKNGNKILIKVKDTGIGIGKEDLRKVFALFERGKRALKKHTEGYGIGMYVVSQFVKLHQGRVWFESEGENKGSTFYVELPKEVEVKIGNTH